MRSKFINFPHLLHNYVKIYGFIKIKTRPNFATFASSVRTFGSKFSKVKDLGLNLL